MREQSENYGLLNLKEIFNNGKRRFVIPNYQRGYSWESSQREDLLKDIENIMDKDYVHYTGTIVASKKSYEDTYEVVDGQQRLTSLSLLIASIYHSDDLKPREDLKKRISSMFLFNSKNGNTIRNLTLNHDLNVLYKEIIKKGKSSIVLDTKSHHNIQDAFNEFLGWLEEKQPNIDRLIETLETKLGFLFYTPQKTSEIGLMFEVINNRGKSLSELEKVKNYLLYYSQKHNKVDLEDLINDKWGLILKELNKAGLTSNQDENDYLRNCWIIFKDTNKSKSYQVYNNLKFIFESDIKGDNYKELEEFVNFLIEAAKAYCILFKNAETYNGEGKKWLELISYHPVQASIIPLCIAIMTKLPEDSTEELFEIIEKLNFRYYVLKIATRADKDQGYLFWLAHTFYNHYEQNVVINKRNIICDVKWLKNALIEFVQNKANIHDVVKSLTLDKDESGDYYNWNGIRFFLASYEEFLADKENNTVDIKKLLSGSNKEHSNAAFHKEHIWARGENTVINNEPWHVNKRRLGNFILLEPSTNIQVSDHTVKDKINEYNLAIKNKPHTRMLRELEGFYKLGNLYADKNRARNTYLKKLEVIEHMLDKREEKLVGFAIKRWGLSIDIKTKIKLIIDSSRKENEIFKLDGHNTEKSVIIDEEESEILIDNN